MTPTERIAMEQDARRHDEGFLVPAIALVCGLVAILALLVVVGAYLEPMPV